MVIEREELEKRVWDVVGGWVDLSEEVRKARERVGQSGGVKEVESGANRGQDG